MQTGGEGTAQPLHTYTISSRPCCTLAFFPSYEFLENLAVIISRGIFHTTTFGRTPSRARQISTNNEAYILRLNAEAQRNVHALRVIMAIVLISNIGSPFKETNFPFNKSDVTSIQITWHTKVFTWSKLQKGTRCSWTFNSLVLSHFYCKQWLFSTPQMSGENQRVFHLKCFFNTSNKYLRGTQ